MSILTLIRPDLLSMKAYQPKGDDLACRLHANESPTAPFKTKNLALNYYPDQRQIKGLEEKLASYYQVQKDSLLVTRGSDDGIDLLMRFFLRAGVDSILQCTPTFSMYAFYATLQQADIVNCPLDSANDFSFSMEQLISTWQPSCKLIMLCRPNNPTGTLIKLTIIAALCEYFANKAVIVVDEAYIEFAQTKSATSLIERFDNLIILRTLSKAFGLAALRLGAIVAQPQVIQALQNTIPPYSLSTVVVDLALRALNRKWLETNVATILKQRQLMIDKLSHSPWISNIYPSHTNFILVTSPKAQALAIWLAQQNIAVRSFANSQELATMIRISIGTSAQNSALLTALASFKP